MSFFTKIFGESSDSFVKEIQPILEKINSLEADIAKFSDGQIKEEVSKIKERIKNGEPLDEVLAPVFALVREAGKRTLNQRHYDSQVVGGIALHQGKIAEMKTGEGKTLAATLALCLNALEGKGAHLITVNDYLSKRDAIWMGQIYYALGLSTSCIVHDSAFIYDPEYQDEKFQIPNSKFQISSNNQNLKLGEKEDERDEERDIKGGFKIVKSYLRPVSRKEAYAADITYGTNNEFGFDYLRDNLVYDLGQKSQRGYNFSIIDEVDSILIDEARTPLIISAPDMESSKWYQDFARIIPKLNSETDYKIDEKMKAVTLTEEGMEKVEKILGMGNIYEEKGIKYVHHLEQSLRAEALFKKDKDYVSKDGQIIIVDEFTGRLMPGRRWSGGLHQAIEAKEGVFVQPESLTLASITFQNYFRMYKKLSGMTGTALTSADEFDKVYKLETVLIPTNKPTIRKDLPDKVYKTVAGKFKAVVAEIKEKHEKGQPILVGTTSIEKNEYLGKLLEREGIAHQILNAKNHEKEGEIIAQAGRFGAVTIATNMAGRGVDIILGGNPPNPEESKKVTEAGGLHVIGTERHEARRIDNQLRGRAGRQGDSGSSQFFLSLEDDLLRVFGGDRIKSLMEKLNLPEDEPIEVGILSNAIESAQAKIEGFNFDSRKHVLEYDDVLNKHREIIYKRRLEILGKTKEEGLRDQMLEIVAKAGFSKDDYEKKEKELGPEVMRHAEKAVSLRILDSLWMEHLENMEYLRDAVRLRAYGQRDPIIEYKNEGHKAFQELLKQIELTTAETILKITLAPQRENPQFSQPAPIVSQKQLTGRNDPCPCGSGKKYKKCCMNK